MRASYLTVLCGVGLSVAMHSADAQRPAVVFRDTVTLAPAKLALTAYAGMGVLVEIVGSDPRQATFLSDSSGRQWQRRTFSYLADVADGTPAGRAPWTTEFDAYAGGRPQGLLLGYVERDGARGQAELALTMYRSVFDASTAIPVTPQEAQRFLGRVGTALDAASAAATPNPSCSEPPELGRPALMPNVETRRKYVNGELYVAFYVNASGRAEPETIDVLWASDRAFETSTRRFIERTEYQPGRGAAGPCRIQVMQPFAFQVAGDQAAESTRRTRIARLP